MSAPRLRLRPILFVLLILAGAAGAAAQWYASDETGVLRERISEEATSEHEYVVRVERSGSQEIEVRYREGEAVGRTEADYVERQLVTRRIYRADELVATEHFRYWADGSLRHVRRVSERGTTVEYRYRDGLLSEEWLSRGTRDERTRYDRLGRIVSRIARESGEEVEREAREYWGDSADDAVRRVVVVADGEEIVRRYDEEGRLLGSSTARGGDVERDRVRIFEDGVLVEERETLDGVTRVWRYEYEEGRLTTERYLENDTLVRVTAYPPPSPKERATRASRRSIATERPRSASTTPVNNARSSSSCATAR
ncbi:MAG: hypothetical protein ACOC1U_01175 [Spirochaetota bacterium]